MVSSSARRRFRLTEGQFVAISWACYVAFIALLALRHEPWQDETRAWQLASTSQSLQALVHNVQYEGHPYLYFLLLKAISVFSRSWVPVVVLNVMTAATAAWVVLRFAPFQRHQRLLIVFSYYFAYEFAVLSRPYVLGLLLACSAVAAWTYLSHRKRWLAIGLLILLANTSAMGLILALAIGAGFTIDEAWSGDDPHDKIRLSPLIFGAVAAIVVTLGVAIQLIPPATSGYHGAGVVGESGLSLWTIAYLLGLPFKATAPFSRMSGDRMLWDWWVFHAQNRAIVLVGILLSMVTVGVWLSLASRRRSALAIFFSGLVGFVVFFGMVHTGGARHHAHIAFAWILAVWVGSRGPATPLPFRRLQRIDRDGRVRSKLLTLALIPMSLPLLPAAWSEIRYPFSDANRVAAILQSPDLDTLPVVGVTQPWSQTVAALANRPIHFPSGLVAIVDYKLPQKNPVALFAGSDTVVANLLATHCRVVLISDFYKPYPTSFPSTSVYRTRANSTMTSSGAFHVDMAYAPASSRCPAAPSPRSP